MDGGELAVGGGASGETLEGAEGDTVQSEASVRQLT